MFSVEQKLSPCLNALKIRQVYGKSMRYKNTSGVNQVSQSQISWAESEQAGQPITDQLGGVRAGIGQFRLM